LLRGRGWWRKDAWAKAIRPLKPSFSAPDLTLKSGKKL
jgi:hypothetical protein